MKRLLRLSTPLLVLLAVALVQAAPASAQNACLSATVTSANTIYSGGDFGCRYDLGINGSNKPTQVLQGVIKSEVPSGANDCGSYRTLDLGVATHTISGLTAQWSQGDFACIYTCPANYALVAVVAENTTGPDDCNNYACRYIGAGGDRVAIQSSWNAGDHSCDYTCPAGYALQGFVAENPIGSADCNSFGSGCQKIGDRCENPVNPQCSDGVDNTDAEDTLADAQDPGCITNGVYNPQDNDETNGLSCPAGQALEYTMTTVSTAVWNANGSMSGSGPVTCPNPGAGWTKVDTECLISGGPCYAQSCLWSRPAVQDSTYLLTHAGGMYYQSLSCANTPPAGYTLKARGCYARNGVGPYNCFSDSCLWEKTGGPNATLLLGHAGGNNGDSVNCANTPPAGHALNSKICILSNGPCFSDLCLWQKENICPAQPQCSDGVDNTDAEDTLADAQDPGCYTNGVYNPQDNDETNTVTLPQCSDGVDNTDAEDTLADAQDPGCYTNGVYNPQDNDETNVIVPPTLPQCSDGADNDGDGKTDFFDPGCYPNGVFNPTAFNPNDNDESNAAQLCRWARVNNQWVRQCQ